MAKKAEYPNFEVRHMTIRIKKFYSDALAFEAYAEACKSRIFMSTKKVAEAITKKDKAYKYFWTVVGEEWPDTLTANMTVRKDESIEIQRGK